MTNREAINLIKGIEEDGRNVTTKHIEALDLAIKALEEQERPTGEWEDYSVDFYRCPECGYLLEKDCPCCQNKVILPNCGAEMREKAEND